jgi:putative copper resistance protein D
MERIVVVWLHLVGAVVWVGGLLYVSHLVVPALARGERAYLGLLVRGRVVAWAAIGLLLVTGLDNLRRARLDSPWLIGKLLLAMVLLALAAHRDFGLLPRVRREIEQGVAPALALAGIRGLDRVLVLLAAAILFLAVGVARGR